MFAHFAFIVFTALLATNGNYEPAALVVVFKIEKLTEVTPSLEWVCPAGVTLSYYMPARCNSEQAH